MKLMSLYLAARLPDSATQIQYCKLKMTGGHLCHTPFEARAF